MNAVTVNLGSGRLILILPLFCEHLLHHTALEHQLVLQLCLLGLSQLRELLYDILPVFQTKSSNYFTSFAITLRLCDIVVLFTHMHIPGCIRSILLATVVEARVFFFEFLGTSSDMLLPLCLSFAYLRGHLILHLKILNQTIYKLILGLHQEV